MAHWRRRIALPGPSWDSLLILTSSAVRYGLHERLLVQTAQADEVKRSAHAQAEVFKAYVGGLYREQGLDVVTRWLRSVFQLDIKEAYESVRREHLLPPLSPTAI